MVKRHVKRQVNSYRYAAKGLRHTLQTQVNIWVHLAATVTVLVLAYLLEFTLEQYLILLLTIGLVLVAELLNTAIEELTDLLSPEIKPQAGVVKDIAAAAVLTASVVAAGVGITLFGYAAMLKWG